MPSNAESVIMPPKPPRHARRCGRRRSPRTSCGTPPRCGSSTTGVDTSVIALWLGHVSIETTQIYLHADMTLKERALARTRPPNSRRGRYQPPDTLLAWLERL